MNRHECGTENNHDAKFCSNCGEELHVTEPATKTASCFQCGFENDRSGRFCANCGAELKQGEPQQQARKHSQKQQLPKKKGRSVPSRLQWNPMFVGLLLVILGGTLYYTMKNSGGQQLTQRRLPLVETGSNDPKVEEKVLAVASKFVCSCGTCGEQSLDVCACETAVEERQFIRNAVQTGQSEQQVIASVNSTYGWIKQQYASQYDSTGRSRNITTKLTLPAGSDKPLLTLPLLATKNKLATVEDRIEIFSLFKCPCGQCSTDELKDCSCQHPRGATEVKAFVDHKISENRYSITEVIDFVGKKYGGMKF